MKVNNHPHILYLSYEGLTDPLGQSQILPYLRSLSSKGFRFSIVSFEKANRLSAVGAQTKAICQVHNISWFSIPYTKKPAVLSTIFDLRRMYRQTIKISKEDTFALVHCRAYLPSIIALKVKSKTGIPFLFDMRGFWADERIDVKIWNIKNPIYLLIYNFFKRKERAFLEEATAIVSLTQAGKTEIMRRFNEDNRFGGNSEYYSFDRALAIGRKTTVIPCATDLQLFDPGRITPNKKNWLCAVHGLNPELEYLGYVGSLGTWYMASEMLALYGILLKSNPSLRFLIISQDDTQNLFINAGLLGIPRSYIIHISAERKEMPALMSLMVASVFFILPAYSKIASSPTKQGELMAMGVPVICNNGVGDTAEIVSSNQSGFVIDAFQEQDFQAVAQNWDHIKSLNRERISKGAESVYALTKGIDQYSKIYKNILSETESSPPQSA